MDKIVKNDGKGLVELLKLAEGTLEHQGNYCFMAALDTEDEEEMRIVDIYTEPVDENNQEIRVNEVHIDGEQYEFCEWCNELHPLNELKKERKLGCICDTCQQAIASRGEPLDYED